MPLIAGVDADGRHMNAIRIDVLEILSKTLRRPQQEIAPTVISVRRSSAIQRRQPAREVEAAARALKGLGLKVINHKQLIFRAETQLMRALAPA